MKNEEIKYILNLFASDLITEIEKGLKKSNCNQCAKGYVESGMIVKNRLKIFLDKLEK